MPKKPPRYGPTVTTLDEVESLIPVSLRREVERQYRKSQNMTAVEEFLVTEFLIRTGREVTPGSVHDFISCVATDVHDEEQGKMQILKLRDPPPKGPDTNVWD